MICQETNQVVVYTAPNRTAATLGPLIFKHCIPGSINHNDGWLTYITLNYEAHGLIHQRNVHLRADAVVRHFQNAHLIEGFWYVLKHCIRHVYHIIAGTRNCEDFLYQGLWRRQIRLQPTVAL